MEIKQSTNIFDKNGKEIFVGSTVITEDGKWGTIVGHEGHYMIRLDPEYIRINRLCKVAKKVKHEKN